MSPERARLRGQALHPRQRLFGSTAGVVDDRVHAAGGAARHEQDPPDVPERAAYIAADAIDPGQQAVELAEGDAKLKGGDGEEDGDGDQAEADHHPKAEQDVDVLLHSFGSPAVLAFWRIRGFASSDCSEFAVVVNASER